MRTTILYLADYFDLTKIDEQFEPEYKEAAKLPEFGIAFYNQSIGISNAYSVDIIRHAFEFQ